MKVKYSEVFGVKSVITSIAIKIRNILGILIASFLFMNFANGLDEFGECDFVINGKADDGFTTGDRKISWVLENGIVSVDWPDYGNSFEIFHADTPREIIRSFKVNLVNTNTAKKDDKIPYLEFTKRSNKGNNLMEINLMPKIPNPKTIFISSKYSIQSGRCTIKYMWYGNLVHQEDIAVKTSGVMTNFSEYIEDRRLSDYLTNNKISSVPRKPKGICFFDIDGTLTQNSKDINDLVINSCLQRGFLVGIITASPRRVEDVCALPSIPSNLCYLIKMNSSYMYNSFGIRSGKAWAFMPEFSNVSYNPEATQEEFAKIPALGEKQGYRKAYQAQYFRDTYYPSIPDQCVILFDDQYAVLRGYKAYGKNNYLVVDPTSNITGRPEIKSGKPNTEELKFSYFYANPNAVPTARLSIGVADGKTALIAAIPDVVYPTPQIFNLNVISVRLNEANVWEMVSYLINYGGCNREISPDADSKDDSKRDS